MLLDITKEGHAGGWVKKEEREGDYDDEEKMAFLAQAKKQPTQ